MNNVLPVSEWGLSTEEIDRLKNLALFLDTEGSLPGAALDIITAHRHFHLFVPKLYGGLDLTLPQGMRIVESYASIDGNLGWLVQIGAGGGVFAAYLHETEARRFYGNPSCVIAGSDFVGGHGEAGTGGYSVSGKWNYASGAGYATAFTGNVRIPQTDGNDVIRAVIVPSGEVEVIQNWNAMGMRATESHSFRITNVFVPKSQLFSLESGALKVPTRTSHISFEAYARALFMPVLTGTAYGYAQMCRDYLDERGTDAASPVQQAVDRLTRAIDWGREQLYAEVEEFSGNRPAKLSGPGEENTRFQKTCLRITKKLQTCLDECHWNLGMKGVLMHDPLNIAYRNFKTVTAHRLLRP